MTLPGRLPAVAAPDPTLVVRRAQQGDERAFEALYDLYGRRIFALALRMTRSPQAAEDALQEVFVKAWQALPGFRGDSSFGSWVHRIAVRVLIDRHRRAPREVQDERLEETAGAAVPGSSLDVERAIGSLPERARLTLLLSIHGHRYEEIAEIMGTEVGTVKAQLHRARRLVREALS